MATSAAAAAAAAAGAAVVAPTLLRIPKTFFTPKSEGQSFPPPCVRRGCSSQCGWSGRRPPAIRTRALVCERVGREAFDPELRLVLELASDEELFELEDILFGPSYFSPILKSLAHKPDMDYESYREDIEGREEFINHLESRFFFLAADARSTMRGWRPSYRNVLLNVRRKLGIPCSCKLSTEDLEVEIFLHLLHEYSSVASLDLPVESNNQANLELGLDKWKIHSFKAFKVGAREVRDIILKGGGILTLVKLYQLLSRRLSGKMLMQAANFQIKSEIMKRGGQFAAVNLESRMALLAARMGLARAASRYLGLRSLMMLLGPLMWGTFLADVVIQMLGTDYARILRAIYAFAQVKILHFRNQAEACKFCVFLNCCNAQIRLTRTSGWMSSKY